MTEDSRGSRTRAKLLQAASTLLFESGPNAVTVRAVGAAAGVARMTPYRHFKDKDDLLSAVATQSLEYLRTAMADGAGKSGLDTSPLYGACLGYVTAAMERPAHYRLVFGDFQIARPSLALQQTASGCMNYLCELVAQAQEKQPSRCHADVRHDTSLIWASLHGLIDLTLTAHLREPITVDGATHMTTLIKRLLEGIELM